MKNPKIEQVRKLGSASRPRSTKGRAAVAVCTQRTQREITQTMR